jgi:hypothetical protein
MIEKFFESAGSFLKTFICGALLLAATAVAITVAICLILTSYRLIELLWHEVFSFSWNL